MLIYNMLRRIPPRPSLWLLFGPAFVWAATAQGSGELIWWPYLVARYGKAFLFLLLPAAAIQYFVNREISKYTATTGQGIWTGFWAVNRYYTSFLFLLCFVNFLWLGGYASAGGSSLYEIFKFPGTVQSGSIFWSYVLIFIFSYGLIFSKVIYRFIEKIMVAVTIITLAGLIISTLLVASFPTLIDFFEALINPLNLGRGVDWSDFDYSQLISGLVFAGMGGYLNLMYSYWMKDKGVGMAVYNPKILGLRHRTDQPAESEIKFADNHQNRHRYLQWLGYLRLDSFLAVAINLVTIFLTSYLAFVLLWPQRQYPSGWSITVAQSAFFGTTFGIAGKIFFLIVAAAFLIDTWLSIVDGISRQYADFSFSASHYRHRQWWYFFWLFFLIIVSLITIPLASPAILLKTTGVISVFAFVGYIPLLWYLNYRHLPSRYPAFVRDSRLRELSLWFVFATYLILASWYLVQVL